MSWSRLGTIRRWGLEVTDMWDSKLPLPSRLAAFWACRVRAQCCCAKCGERGRVGWGLPCRKMDGISLQGDARTAAVASQEEEAKANSWPHV
ncbi:unnamed protein product [Effrenium voratum]|nr:unnamed protein product [Effrenium voratum]